MTDSQVHLCGSEPMHAFALKKTTNIYGMDKRKLHVVTTFFAKPKRITQDASRRKRKTFKTFNSTTSAVIRGLIVA